MQKMFHGKFVAIIEVQPVAKTQTATADVNVVDVNVTTSKVTEEHVFKDREPRKIKNAAIYFFKWLKKPMVQTIQ
jgi:hypothetical protein